MKLKNLFNERLSIKKRVVPALSIAILLNTPVFAIDTDPLDYVAPKAGVNVFGFYYGNWQSNKQYSNSNQVGNTSIDVNYGTSTLVRFHDVGGYVVGTKLILPVKNVEVGNSDNSGIGDPTLAFPVWLYSNPQTSTHFAINTYLQLPLGEYDKNDTVNLGDNRYSLTFQPGFTTALTDKLSLDLVADVQFFGKNDDIKGGSKHKKENLYSVQTHLTYSILPNLQASIGAYKYIGGETSIDGVGNNDKTNTTTGIASLGYWATGTDNFQIQYRTDTSVKNGAEFDGIQLRYLHIF
jgi:hypothetical protein